MADKPSNSRRRVSYQPARNGQAARWQIEERKSSKASTRSDAKSPTGNDAKAPSQSSRREAARPRETYSQKARAQARAAERRKDTARKNPATKSEPRSQKERAQARAAERRKEQSSRPLPDKQATAKERSKPQREQEQRATRMKRPERVNVSAAEQSGKREPEQRPQRPERVMAENPQRARHASSDRTRGHVMEAMMPQASKGGGQATVFGLSMRNVLIVILLLVVIVFFLWHPWSSGTDAAVAPEETAPVSDILEERLATVPTYGIVAPVDFNAVEEEGFTAGFVLAHGGVVTDYSIYDTEPELSDESAEALNQALQPFTESDVITAFLLMDIQTGRGFARNVDKTLYGASSFKGPYCAYLLKQYVDNGDVEITDSFASGYMTASLGYARYGSDTLKNLIKETITESSNDAFASLRVNFSDNTLASWLTSVDVDNQVAYDTWFPFNTVRNMAKLWMETYYFLQTNTDAAQTLRDYMGSTTKSFMREALTGVRVYDEDELVEEAAVTDVDADGGEEESTDADDAMAELEDASTLRATGSIGQNIGSSFEHSIDVLMAPEITVLDKAGWNIDPDPNYDALVDCGIVTCNGREYLLCVMCDAAYTESNVDKFEQLIAAIFEARRDLA